MSQSEDGVAPIYQDQFYSPDLMQPVVAGGIVPSAYYSDPWHSPNIMPAVVQPVMKPVVSGRRAASASMVLRQQPPEIVVNSGAFELLSPEAKTQYVAVRSMRSSGQGSGMYTTLDNLKWYLVYCVDARSSSSCSTAF
jgi:hypothetical protein